MANSRVEITTGEGSKSLPYRLSCQADVSSTAVFAYIRQHISELAATNNWHSLEMVNSEIEKIGLSILEAYAINYEIWIDDETEYYSAIIWYDITHPWTLIAASKQGSH